MNDIPFPAAPDRAAAMLSLARPDDPAASLAGLAGQALDELGRMGEVDARVLLLAGHGGPPAALSRRIVEEMDEKELAVVAWLAGVERRATAMFSVVHSMGARAGDAPGTVREFLVASASLRAPDDGSVRSWASVTEVRDGRVVGDGRPAAAEEVTARAAGTPGFDEVSLHVLPAGWPSGSQRADARRRLRAAARRVAQGRPPFPDALHARLGW